MISQFALECALTTAFGSACCQEEVPDSAVLMNSGFLPVTWLDLGIVWGFSKLRDGWGLEQHGPVGLELAVLLYAFQSKLLQNSIIL